MHACHGERAITSNWSTNTGTRVVLVCMCRQAAAKVSGAMLMAVMRGRSSEGVDFLDDCARAVVVVGIPYPPLYETSVRLKRAFNRDHEALLGSGDDWYAAEAFRAVNQAIGEPYSTSACPVCRSCAVKELHSTL